MNTISMIVRLELSKADLKRVSLIWEGKGIFLEARKWARELGRDEMDHRLTPWWFQTCPFTIDLFFQH